MFDCILVPLDGSPLAERALALLPAIPCRRALLVRATPDDDGASLARDYLARIVAELAARRIVAEARALTGDPAERIVEAAAAADLIAMTSRGRGGGGQRLFGSVADRVARHAPAPTLILRAGDDVALPAADGRIVVPLDGSAVAMRAVTVARLLGLSQRRPLHLVGVSAAADDAAAGALAAHLAAVAAELRADGLDAAVDTRRGEPAIELLAAVRGGDLVVMTTHGASGGQRWRVGHVAERMLRRSPAPVVLVRGDHAAADSASPLRVGA